MKQATPLLTMLQVCSEYAVVIPLFVFPLQVKVGNIHKSLGYVQYYNSNWQDASVQAAVIACIIIIALLVIVMVVSGVWYKKFREKYPLPNRLSRLLGMQHEDRPNEYTSKWGMSSAGQGFIGYIEHPAVC